jgi:hypothetical protein
VNAGTGTSFTASAVGEPTPSVQWYISTNGGGSFSPLSDGSVYTGTATGTLSISTTTASMNGYEYEAIFSNGVSPIGTTTPATLTVDYAPAITTQPVSGAVTAGGNASFTAAASGNPSPSVQWEVNTGSGFNPITTSGGGIYSGYTTGTLTITGATASMNGYQYEAVFSNGVSPPATSNAATLTVDTAPTIGTEPPSSTTVNAGSNTSIAATSSGENPAATVQWYVSTDGGGSFKLLGAGGVYGASVTSPTLTITGATANMNGYEYKAVFSNSVGSVTTSIDTLTVDFAPTIVGQPVSTTVPLATPATFTVVIDDGSPTPTQVQWLIDTGTGFAPLTIASPYSVFQQTINGVTTATLTIAATTAAMNGYRFEATASANGMPSFSNTSSAGTLTVGPAVGLTSPVDDTTVVGGSASFSATLVGGSAPAIQWFYSSNKGKTFTAITSANAGTTYSGYTRGTLSIQNATVAMNGYEYEATFVNSLGSQTTAKANLFVDGPTSISGTTAGQHVSDAGTISPFAKVVLSGTSNAGQYDNVTVTLYPTAGGTASGFTANGSLTPGSGGSYANGVFTDTGVTLAQAQADLRSLVFTPTAHQVVPGSSVTTYFTLQVSSFNTLVSPPVPAGPTMTNQATSVIAAATSSPTVIGGTQANQAAQVGGTIQPFQNVTLTNPDNPAELHTLTVKVSNAANGTLPNLSGGTYTGGVYTLAKVTLAQAQAALQGLVFTPTAPAVLGSKTTTGFTITVTNSSPVPVSTNATTSVVSSTTLQNVGLVVTQGPTVDIYSQSGVLISQFNPFANLNGVQAVQAVVGDVLDTGHPDLVVATGPEAGQVKVYDGITGQVVETLMPYGNTWTKGLFIAVGNVLGTDPTSQDIVVAPGGPGKPVEIFDHTGTMVSSFVPLPTQVPHEAYTNGVHIAVGSLDGTGQDQIIVGTSAPQAGYAEVWDWNGSSMAATGQTYTVPGQGVYLATIPSGSGYADLVLGTQVVGKSNPQTLEVLDGMSGNLVASLTPVFGTGNTQEVRVAVRDVTGDGVPDIIVATGAGSTFSVKVFDLGTNSLTPVASYTSTQLHLSVNPNVGEFVG